MTAKNNKKPSIPGDKYYTPRWLVRQCFDIIVPEICPNPELILEPCVGSGRFAEQFPDAEVTGIDIDAYAMGPKYCDFYSNEDFLQNTYLNNKSFDLVITNPPFTLAREFIEKSLEVANTGIFLVRRGILSGADHSRPFP